MKPRVLLLLLLALALVPGWAQESGSGGMSSKAVMMGSSPVFNLGDMTTIGPDGTFYWARMRSGLRTDTATSILPQQTIVRAIGVTDTRDPRWQTTVEGFPNGLVAGERNVYLTVVSLPILTMGPPNTGSAIPIPIISGSRLVLMSAANGNVVRTVNLAGGAVRSLELKKVGNNEFIYAVTMAQVTILIFPPPPPTPLLEIFDADGNRIKQVTLSANY